MLLSDVSEMCNWEEGEDQLFKDYNFPKMTPSEQKAWYEIKNSKKTRCFVIVNKEDKILGYISMKKINKFLKTSEMGIVIAPNQVNKGIGTEAIKLYMQWYFKILKYNKIWLQVGEYNKRAINCYTKLGFKKKKKLYDDFYNYYIDPINDDNFKDIRSLFKERFGKIKTLYYIMEITSPYCK